MSPYNVRLGPVRERKRQLEQVPGNGALGEHKHSGVPQKCPRSKVPQRRPARRSNLSRYLKVLSCGRTRARTWDPMIKSHLTVHHRNHASKRLKAGPEIEKIADSDLLPQDQIFRRLQECSDLKSEAKTPRISLSRSVIRPRAYLVRSLRLCRIEFSVHTGLGPLPKRCRPKVFSHPSNRKGQPIRDRVVRP